MGALRALEAVEAVPSYSAISPPTDLQLRRLHDEERVVRPRPLRAHVEGARRRKAAGVVEVRADHLAVLQVGLLQPHHHRLRLEAAVALRQDELSTRLQHAVNLLEDLERLDQVVDADDARGGVEGVVVVRQRRVDVEVLRLKVGELRVARELALHHARRRDPRHLLRKVGRVVRDPAAANVQDRAARRYILLVIVGERAHRAAGGEHPVQQRGGYGAQQLGSHPPVTYLGGAEGLGSSPLQAQMVGIVGYHAQRPDRGIGLHGGC